MPQKFISLTKFGINCVLIATFMPYSEKTVFLVAIVDVFKGHIRNLKSWFGSVLGGAKEPPPLSSPTVGPLERKSGYSSELYFIIIIII